MILPAAIKIISGITIYTIQTVWQDESNLSQEMFDPLANLHCQGENVTRDPKHKALEGPIVLSTITHKQDYKAN